MVHGGVCQCPGVSGVPLTALSPAGGEAGWGWDMAIGQSVPRLHPLGKGSLWAPPCAPSSFILLTEMAFTSVVIDGDEKEAQSLVVGSFVAVARPPHLSFRLWKSTVEESCQFRRRRRRRPPIAEPQNKHHDKRMKIFFVRIVNKHKGSVNVPVSGYHPPSARPCFYCSRYVGFDFTAGTYP